MKIILLQKTVYGVKKFYPVNEQAHALAYIARTKTLNPSDIRHAADAFGCEIEVQHEANPFAKAAA